MDARPPLPHRYPFEMLDPGGSVARVRLSADDARSRGGPVPPWALVEALAQAAGLACAGEGASGGSLVQVNRLRWPRPVLPGETLDLCCTLVRQMGPLRRVRVAVRREGRLVATAVLTLRVEGGA